MQLSPTCVFQGLTYAQASCEIPFLLYTETTDSIYIVPIHVNIVIR